MAEDIKPELVVAETNDLEKGDHTNVADGANGQTEASRSADEIPTVNLENEALSRLSTNVADDENPFAFFPQLSVSMSSTQGPWLRRNTTTSLGRPLTREETRQTLRTVRSRFTEVRSEFDENVPSYQIGSLEFIIRMIYPNLLRLMRISSHSMAQKIR
jgi:hypothetical protein